ncbi:hypothetical protein BSR29_02210 [Boudabousia liubingyangii]|uniref:ABC transmembrane type-1 domain-containing protein n=1 Tax=Boudabousia liubingyangii TaxID=1921764 RepID=A0A1Q5PQL0_9ACTO|nr:ABC transporter permease [Boudabousia liubingyangii]OKL48188.1 hypothetical protein BSR28_00275 [Boudabousia liubingyangii]OKL49783.1 hypothetical protein BSR29_02210 [Boudabousia liubingyangii]
MSLRKRTVSTTIGLVLTVLLLLGIWEAAVFLFSIRPQILPAPSVIFHSAVEDWAALSRAVHATSFEVFWGLLAGCLLGVLAGLLIFASRILQSSLYPLLLAAQTVPIIAIAPLIMIWMGFGYSGKILLVAVYASFPVVAATVRGMKAVDRSQVQVARSLGASWPWVYGHVFLPGAARQIFTGVKISATYAFGTAAMSEYVGAANGLGVYLNAAKVNFRTDLVFVAGFALALCTLVLFALLSVLERVLIRWPEGGVHDD